MTNLLVTAFAEELATVFGALIDSPVVATAADPAAGAAPPGRQWTATVVADHPSQGACTLRVDEAGAAALATQIIGLSEAAPEAAVGDTLKEAVAQALGSLSLKDVAKGVPLRLSKMELAAGPATGPAARFTLTAAGLPTIIVTIDGTLDLDVAAPVQAKPAPSPETPAADDRGGQSPADRIDVILDIDLPLIVRFGRTELPLRTLARMGPGSLIDLGRSADDPVEVLVSNRVVARGEVVIVGGNYGVRILDVVSPKERVRSMEA